MKKHILFCSALVLTLSGCNKPKERAAIVNKDVVDKVFAIKDLPEITGANDKKTVIIKSASKDSILAMDGKLTIATTDGKIGDLLKKVKTDATKAALDDQLGKNSIALVILKDQVKIYKVLAVSGTGTVSGAGAVTDTTTTTDADVAPATDSSSEASAPQDLLTFNYLSRLKAQSKADAQAQSNMQTELDAAKLQKPTDVGEKYGFVEITSLCVEKVGILENERTDYGEKKSTLNVTQTQFDLATHVIVGDEPTADKPCGSPAKKSSDDE